MADKDGIEITDVKIVRDTTPKDSESSHSEAGSRRPSIDIIKKRDFDDMNLAQKVHVEKERSASNLTAVQRVTTIIPDHEEEGSLLLQQAWEKSVGLTTEQANKLLAFHGRNELPEKRVPKWKIFVGLLIQPMPIMIWLAAIVEIAIQNYLDMGILIFINMANASIGYYETTKADDAVQALKKSLKSKAFAKRDGKFKEVDAALIVPGDLISLTSGGAIPADCRTNEGQIDVDQAALTGESLPVTMYSGDECKMGSTVARGETEATVTSTGANTFFGKTAALLAQDNEITNFQKMLIRIVSVLVVICITFCVIVLIYLLVAKNIGIQDALSFVVVLLVASIPMAMEIVTTTTLALGSKELSHHGAIVKQLAAIEDMAGMAILCSDKTGTLTLNQMVIQPETPVYKEGETQYSLLRYCAMAAKWHEPPKDALDTLVLNAVDKASLEHMEAIEYIPFDPIVKRTEGTVRDKETENTFKTTKGAPHVILKLVEGDTPNHELALRVEHDVHDLGMRGIRSLACAKTNEEGKWEMLGLLTFLDPPRPDTKETIRQAMEYGVSVKMITGDHLLIAKETARVLDLGDFICSADGLPLLDPVTKKKPKDLSKNYGDQCLASNGFAQVFPEHKFLIVECLRELGYKVGMTGDGVNDAPALKRADVGVAVHGATDAAKAAAHICLTEPGLSTIVHGILIARRIFCRIRNFIIYRIAATLQLLLFFFIAVFAFPPTDYSNHWPANSDLPPFFHLPVLMLMLITLLNDGTLISIGYDHAEPRQSPERWNISVLFSIAFTLALVALVSSLLLLWLLLDSWNPAGFFQSSGMGGITYGQVTTAIYLKVSISDFLTLFSSRTGGAWFFQVMPAGVLVGAACFALSLSTILACTWPQSTLDGIDTLGLGYHSPYALAVYIWIYCIVWWLIQDGVKVAMFAIFEKYNIFGINNTGKVILPPSTLKYMEDNRSRVLALADKPAKH